jgi:ribonuclease HII
MKLSRDNHLSPKGKDSKKLSKERREAYAKYLKQLYKKGALQYAISSVSATTIDTKGLSHAIKQSLARSLRAVGTQHKDTILLDGGLKAPKEFTNQQTIIKGDEKEQIIAWASILAKVTRDAYMNKIDSTYPNYGFKDHVGYGTQRHRQAIQTYGPSPIHRKSFLKHI